MSKKLLDNQLYLRRKKQVQNLQKLVEKRNQQIFHLHALLRDRKNIVHILLSFGRALDEIKNKYNLRIEDLFTLQYADLQDIPFKEKDWHKMLRLQRAGFVRKMVREENTTWFIMPAGKLFLEKLSKVTASHLKTVLNKTLYERSKPV